MGKVFERVKVKIAFWEILNVGKVRNYVEGRGKVMERMVRGVYRAKVREAFSSWRSTIFMKHLSIKMWSKEERVGYEGGCSGVGRKMKEQGIRRAEEIFEKSRLRKLFEAWST